MQVYRSITYKETESAVPLKDNKMTSAVSGLAKSLISRNMRIVRGLFHEIKHFTMNGSTIIIVKNMACQDDQK